jgi:nucleoside 2-deoxyribosyltransferase
MKIMVCGSIGYGGIEELKALQDELVENGFEVVDHLDDSMDYSHVQDFRDRPDLSESIVNHDFGCVNEADVIVALIGKPSYGTAMEVFRAQQLGKTIFSYCPEPVSSPWPLHFSDEVFLEKEALLEELHRVTSAD